MKKPKPKTLFYVSLGGTLLFALLTLLMLLAPFFSVDNVITKPSYTGFNLMDGSQNDINGVTVNCDAFVIITIILCALVIAATVLRGFNIVPKYTKLISSAVISLLSVALMVVAIIFVAKINSFNNGTINLRTVALGAGAILYLIFGILTALCSVSLFVTDGGKPGKKRR